MVALAVMWRDASCIVGGGNRALFLILLSVVLVLLTLLPLLFPLDMIQPDTGFVVVGDEEDCLQKRMETK